VGPADDPPYDKPLWSPCTPEAWKKELAPQVQKLAAQDALAAIKAAVPEFEKQAGH
jgi:hypothetical protein